MTTKAYSYLRVSGKGQVEGGGFDRQRETIQRFAKRNRYAIVDEYREKGVSGTTDETNRPAFQSMVAEILSNGVRTIVVESMDRFARDLGVQLQLLAYLKAKGITLISAATGEDVTAAIDEDPMRKAMIQMQGVFAELDKSTLVLKLRKARQRQRAKTGKCEGRKAYGEKEGEAELIARVKQLHRKPRKGRRRTYQSIADALNDEGFRRRNGKPWTRQSVERLVKAA